MRKKFYYYTIIIVSMLVTTTKLYAQISPRNVEELMSYFANNTQNLDPIEGVYDVNIEQWGENAFRKFPSETTNITMVIYKDRTGIFRVFKNEQVTIKKIGSTPIYNYNPLAELNEVKIMLEKLRISLIFINLVLLKSLSLNHRMHNLYTKFVRILEICKQFSNNLVNDQGNIVRCGPVPKFSDLEVVALSLAAESESIDSEKWLFDYKLQEYKEQIPNLISRRQFNDRRKKTAGLCEAIRKRIALKMDGGEDFFLVDSKPVEVCRLARGKRCKMGQTGDFSKAPDFGYCASQNTYYFGYKLHAVCGLSGVVHSYDLSKASVHDLNYMKDIKLEYHNCSIYGDKGYIGADVQLDLFETAHIRLECPYRLNQKDWKPTFIPFAKARKRIETIFSQLSDQFLIIRNYAKITNGLFARIIGKISALTVSQYANYINNKPIGRIKYALN